MVAAKVKQNAHGAHTFLEVRDYIAYIDLFTDITAYDIRLFVPVLAPLHIFSSPFMPCYAICSYAAPYFVGLIIVIKSCAISHLNNVVGGAATVTAITGMPVEAACLLLPIGIAAYVVVGGLRATFICDWAHTIILFIIIYIFIFKT
jgi:hypothetical protein